MNTYGLNRISLLSSSFSGSTLFGIILCQDPRFIGFGDTYLIPGISSMSDNCCCGARLDECETRRAIHSSLIESGYSAGILTNPRHRIPYEFISARAEGIRLLGVYRSVGRLFGYKNVYRHFLRKEEALLNALAAFGQYQYVIDGAKSAIRADVFNAVDPDSRMIHLIRHPFSVLHSALTRHETRGRSASLIKDDWVVGNRRAMEMCEDNGNRAMSVQYEKLVRDPDETMATIAAWLGLDNIQMNPKSLDLSNCHLIGNRSRHEATAVKGKMAIPSTDDLLEAGMAMADVDELIDAAIEFGIQLD